MKKLFIKFKHWLIKKLGGYIEQKQIARVIVEKECLPVRTVSFERTFSYFSKPADVQTEIELQNKVSLWISDEIVPFLIQNRLLNYKFKEDPISNGFTFRIDLKVCSSENAISFFDALDMLRRRLGL